MTLKELLEFHLKIQENMIEKPLEITNFFDGEENFIAVFTTIKKFHIKDLDLITKSRTLWPATTKALLIAVEALDLECDCLNYGSKRGGCLTCEALAEIRKVLGVEG